MPNLVGIGNSQVPTNAMLGGLAYQDPTNVNVESLEPGNISKISKKLIHTASSPNVKGMFVYNTSHDTDGGQWRHNCQHTSWYSETLGTDVRGTTRKFPKIVVCILFENPSGINGVTDDMIIYDADKPDMSMWMKIRFVISGSGTNTQVRALNGKIVFGSTNNGLCIVDFPNDSITLHNHAHKHFWQGIYPSRLGRSSYPLAHSSETGFAIQGEYIADFDVSVTPDSKINPNTGLHEITIAGTTSGSGGGSQGWWMIKDDGTTQNIGVSGGSSGYGRHGANCAFILGGNYFFAGKNTYGSGDRHSNIYQIKKKFAENNSFGVWPGHQSSFINLVDSSSWGDRSNQIDFFGNFAGELYGKGTCAIDDRVFATSLSSNANSLIRYYIRMNDIRYSMACINRFQHGEQCISGWMPGRAYNANLSSTTPDSDSSGTIGFVENPGFIGTASPWFGDSGASITWQSNGSVLVTNGGGDNTYAIRQNDVFTSGRKYKITGTITPTFSGSYEFRVRAGGSSAQFSKTSGLTSGQAYNFNTGAITADGTQLEIGSLGGTLTQFVLENLRVYDQNDLDRGQYSLMWTINGTIKKERVAPGADLVAYHNFSSGDYLAYDPLNITPGNNDFYVMFWCKAPPSDVGNYFHAWSQGTSSTGGQSRSTGFVIKCGSGTSGLQWYPYSNNGNNSQGIDSTLCIQPYGSWNCIVVGRDNNVWKLYMDGELRDTGDTNTTNFTDQYVTIGKGLSQPSEAIAGCKLALMRYGAGAMPDSAMIKYMYHQEAPLFRDNAKCTLTGTGNDSAQNLKMDFDPDTKLLHVGSGQGRSDFNGLQRINSTTTPVEIALSASGGVIAEA